MVGFPADERETKRTFYKIIFLRGIKNSSVGTVWFGRTFGRKLFHLLIRPVAVLIGHDRLFDMMQRIKDRLDFDESEYVGNMGSSVNTWKGKVRRVDYCRPNQLEFEGRMFSVPGNYKEYLEGIYGKNCTVELPPEEKRRFKNDYKVYKYKE